MCIMKEELPKNCYAGVHVWLFIHWRNLSIFRNKRQTPAPVPETSVTLAVTPFRACKKTLIKERRLRFPLVSNEILKTAVFPGCLCVWEISLWSVAKMIQQKRECRPRMRTTQTQLVPVTCRTHVHTMIFFHFWENFSIFFFHLAVFDKLLDQFKKIGRKRQL